MKGDGTSSKIVLIYLFKEHIESTKIVYKQRETFLSIKTTLRNRGKKQSSKRRRNPHRTQQEIKGIEQWRFSG